MNLRHYLILIVVCVVLVGVVEGLHYGYFHHEPAEEPGAATRVEPWPAEVKGSDDRGLRREHHRHP